MGKYQTHPFLNYAYAITEDGESCKFDWESKLIG